MLQDSPTRMHSEPDDSDSCFSLENPQSMLSKTCIFMSSSISAQHKLQYSNTNTYSKCQFTHTNINTHYKHKHTHAHTPCVITGDQIQGLAHY